ncbi:MAG: PAS domain S-box protein [Candidatus Omnitrophica bacterium]|nr:PAS domain S-box protein [Candidatus Omnitrophota bacterium]MBU4334049.1 PAS domain S-box protein [Candidatus Omnitrophota bacterium]
MRMTIGKKLWISFGILISLMLIMSAISFYSIQNIKDVMEVEIEKIFKGVSRAADRTFFLREDQYIPDEQLNSNIDEMNSLLQKKMDLIIKKGVLDAKESVAKSSNIAKISVVFIGVFSVILGLGLLTIIDRMVSIPISKLNHATDQLSEGNLSINIDIDTKDEIGDLAASFNQMTKSLRNTIYSRDCEITEREWAEEKVRESKEELDVVIRNINDIVFQLTPLGFFRYINPRAKKILGYDPSELIGKHIKVTTPLNDITKVSDALMRVLKGREVFGLEIRQKHKDGDILFAEINAVPIKKDGKVIAVQGIMRDVTDRKKAEEVAFQMFDVAADGMRLIDKDFNMLRVNDTFLHMSGVSKDKIENVKCYDYFQCEFCETEQCPMFQMSRKKKRIELEVVCIKSDGNGVPCILTATPFMDASGEFVGIIEDFKDISEYKRAEEKRLGLESQLRQSQKLESIGTMANGIAHSLNNIIGAIRGYADMAMDNHPKDEKFKNYLEHIIKGTKDAKELSSQMLIFSRKEITDLREVQLHHYIEEAVNFVEASMTSPIKVVRNINDQCGSVLADPNQIQQVVMNLCMNAYQAMSESGGVLEIVYDEFKIDKEFAEKYANLYEGKYSKLSIIDSGSGIDAMNMVRIFEPFFTTKKVGEGSGLGLSVVHGIVREHNGEIIVNSEEGKRTCFDVYLPLA